MTVTLTPAEHQLLRVAAGHAGVPAGELVARWAKRYLARHGIALQVDQPTGDDTEEEA